jgi:peptide/nickel transport system ATP-binding protein/oligopeptide transport system ATP-binding protein
MGGIPVMNTTPSVASRDATGPTAAAAPGAGEDLLTVEGLTVNFPVRSRLLRRTVGQIHAVDNVSLSVSLGETLGIVGESGCGKSTTGKAILQLIKPTAGSVRLRGQELTTLSKKAMMPYRREMQIVLQDPYSSLDPRMTVEGIISEPLEVQGFSPSARRARTGELLELVGLHADHRRRYPHEFSGGQRQRIAIARALALEPRLLVLDEPLSALDVSIQAQIVNLLKRLQREMQVSFILISHDLAVVRQICNRVAVMYLGQIIETGRCEEVYASPNHPYTQALLSAAPQPDPARRGERKRIILGGDLPRPDQPPGGCRFHTRCWRAEQLCRDKEPELTVRDGLDHPSACHFAGPADGTGLGKAGASA